MKKALTENNVLILVDCGALDYISSAGLGVFVSYLEDFKDKKGMFVFYDMKDTVFSVFQILGLDKLMRFATSETEAKELLNEGKV